LLNLQTWGVRGYTGENNKRVNVLIASDLDFVFFFKFSVLFIFIEASSSY